MYSLSSLISIYIVIHVVFLCFFFSPVDDRCDTEIYDCEDHNPCAPEPCSPGSVTYEASDGYYVACDGHLCTVLP